MRKVITIDLNGRHYQLDEEGFDQEPQVEGKASARKRLVFR